MTDHPGPMTRRTELSALAAVLVLSAVLYCWRLGLQGWGNEYYAAAVQAAAHDWGSFFWGGVEWGGNESLDKPPLFVWPMALSVRLFGLSTTAMMAPQILLTVLTTAVLERTVSRTHGAVAGLVAAAVFGFTPVVVVLARFNDPDVAVTFLSVCAAYGVVRHVDSGRRGWVLAAGLAIGIAFLCKWMAGFLAIPALVAALVVGLPTRAAQVRAVATAAGACVVGGLWWVVVYALAPHHPTPDGGSSLADLLLGRNGFSRIVTADVTTRNGASGAPGLARVVTWPMDGQLGWLVPVAVVALWLLWRAPAGTQADTAAARSAGGAVPVRAAHLRRAGIALWGTWFVLVTLVLSFMGGPMHPYYLHVITPGLAAVVALGVEVARRLDVPERGGLLALTTVLTAGLALVVLDAHHLTPTWWARVIEVATFATVGLVVVARRRPEAHRLAALTACVAVGFGPLAFDAISVNHPVLGANPTAGPELRYDTPPLPQAIVDLVRGSGTQYAAAVPMAAHAAMLQLQVDRPVLPVGGYTGRAASPTLARVQALVADRKLRYLVLTGPYAKHDRPKDFIGRPTDEIVQWARGVGCVVPGIPGGFTVIDITSACR